MWMLQGGLGTRSISSSLCSLRVPPADPQRGAARVQTPSSCLSAATANGRTRQVYCVAILHRPIQKAYATADL